MTAIGVETRIAAAPEVVWAVLTDFAGYPAWNPFIRRLSGELVLGGRIEVVLQPDGSGPSTFRPEIVELEPGRSFTWLGHTLIPGIFDGRHHFEVRHADGGTVLEQSESFGGLLVPLLRRTLAAAERGFGNMNQVIKERAEGGGRAR